MRIKIVGAATLAAALTPSLHSEIVYQNTTGDLSQRYSIGAVEVGDELVLGGSSRELTDFDFQYFGISFSGPRQARVRLYYNDGDLFNEDPNARKPLTAFFDSGLFNVPANPRATINFSVSDGSLPAGIVLPDRFTFSVQFSGLQPGETAGLDLYDPPIVGGSLPDFWYNDPVNGWQVRTNDTFVMNFGARVQAVPEPSTVALAAFGALAGCFFLRRKRGQAGI